MMNKKYLIRGVVWTLLVVSLSIFTFYLRLFFIKPLETNVQKLIQDENRNKQLLITQSNQLNLYSDVLYDLNEIEQMVPLNVDLEELQQKYVLRFVFVSQIKQYSFLINEEAPKNLKLSPDIGSKKVTLTMQVEDIDQLYRLMDELYDSKRSVYIGNFSYKLPGEVLPGKKPNSDMINVTLEYYLFYYKK